MVYKELCHKEIDWSKAMKQILISFVAVVLGITAMSSYAEKAREASIRIPTLALDASKAGNDNEQSTDP